MDLHDKEFFDRLMTLTEENNRMLHKMRRAVIWSSVTKIIYWAILIGVSVGAYYYIQPYLDQFLAIYKGINESTAQIQGFVNPFQR